MTGTAANLVVRRLDGTVVPTTPPPTTAHGPDLVAQNRTLGLTITPDTPLSLWDGWSPDYHDAVAGLLALETEELSVL